MTTENIFVELTAPTGKGAAGTNVASTRYAQVTLNAGTIVIDGVTYTRTSPLRSRKVEAADAPQLAAFAATGDASKSPANVSAAVTDVVCAIFSASGT